MSLPIHIAFDGLSGVDGSARFAFGHTIAIASVSGPISPIRLASEHPVRATVDVHVRPLASVPGTTEKRAAIALKGILERVCILAHYPRTLIQVVVQALSPLSSSQALTPSLRASGMSSDTDVLLAAKINACSLALLSAGSIPMRGVVCAVAVTHLPSSSPQLVTEHHRSDSNTDHSGCFAFLFGVDHTYAVQNVLVPPSKMIWTNYRALPGNAFSEVALAKAENVALEGATTVWREMRESLARSSFAGGGPS